MSSETPRPNLRTRIADWLRTTRDRITSRLRALWRRPSRDEGAVEAASERTETPRKNDATGWARQIPGKMREGIRQATGRAARAGAGLLGAIGEVAPLACVGFALLYELYVFGIYAELLPSPVNALWEVLRIEAHLDDFYGRELADARAQVGIAGTPTPAPADGTASERGQEEVQAEALAVEIALAATADRRGALLGLVVIGVLLATFLAWLLACAGIFAIARRRGRGRGLYLVTDRRGIWWYDVLTIVTVVGVVVGSQRFVNLATQEIWVTGLFAVIGSVLLLLRRPRIYVVRQTGQSLPDVAERMGRDPATVIELNPGYVDETDLPIGAEIVVG